MAKNGKKGGTCVRNAASGPIIDDKGDKVCQAKSAKLEVLQNFNDAHLKAQ
jgi:hypothetical protein